MPPDVLVRHCTLTVHGKGGWGWGRDSMPYLAAAVPAIESALERIIAECDLDPEVELLVEEPIHLAWRSDGTLDDGLCAAAVDAIRRCQVAAGGRSSTTGTVEQTARARAPERVELAPNDGATVAGAEALIELVASWSGSGRMRAVVAAWPRTVVETWVARLRALSGDTDAVELDTGACAAIAELVLRGPPATTAPGTSVHDVLVLLAAFVAAAGDRPVGPATFQEAVLLARASTAEAGTDVVEPAVPERAHSTSSDPPGEGPAQRPSETLSHGPQRFTAPGLPFLVLVQLGRIGYLDALVGVAHAQGEVSLAQAWAAGLAGKVLPPPDRGWRRGPEEIEAIAAAAGLAPGDADGLAYSHTYHLVAMAAPMESALVALYAAGRSTSDQVTSTPTDHGVILGETQGCLPVAWLADDSGLSAVLEQLGSPPMTPGDLFDPLADALGVRVAFPHLDAPQPERHCGAAVGAALGSLGRELWGPDLPNAPMTTLERLADLEVELRLDDVLAVAVPRGQRWLDLGRAGLIDRWAVPWARGGYWELVSW